MSERDRFAILDRIERGELTAEEGLRALAALRHEGDGNSPVPAPAFRAPAAFQLAWVGWLAGGLGFALLMSALFGGLWNAGWFGGLVAVLCASPLALVGITVAVLGALSARAPWAHVRVKTGQDRWPQRIHLSVPLPLRPVGWLARTLGRRIPLLERTSVDDVLAALSDSDLRREPIVIDIREGEGGEQVQIVVG